MMDNIRILEHISLRAWAALETEQYDAWLLRYANGYTGRANSVQALDSSSLPLAEKIAYCENWYAERQLPCIFRLTDAMQPPDLESYLEKRGYHRYNETIVQTAPLLDVDVSLDRRFHASETVSDDWLAAWGTWNDVPNEHIGTAKQMLSKQSSTRACFGWLNDSAVGLAVCEGEFVGLFDIVVNPESRRQGLGNALVTSLLAWSKQHGASTAYLQVVANNAAAIALYDKLGFTTHHHYWYRRHE
jgi:ribosomal protein S18 acetylase RimI-like enzyme